MTVPLVMMKWSNNGTADEGEVLKYDPMVASAMEDPPKLQQYGDVAPKSSPDIVSEKQTFGMEYEFFSHYLKASIVKPLCSE